MLNARTILACVDFSEYSKLILENAIAAAASSDAEILVYNVVNQRDISAVEKVGNQFPDRINPETFVKDLLKEHRFMLKQMIKEHFFDEKSRMRIIVEKGVPYESILQLIDKEKVDLVVMANKGRSNVSRVLFGSAAEKIFRHSPVPVLSVRVREKFHRR